MDRKQSIISEFAQDETILGVVASCRKAAAQSSADGQEMILFVVTKSEPGPNRIYNYIREGMRIQERRMSAGELSRSLRFEPNRDDVFWFQHGEIWLDKDGTINELRQNGPKLPEESREERLLLEFAALAKKSIMAKEQLKQGLILDAYSSVNDAMHHWARLTVVEHGELPAAPLWRQVKRINPGVFKLYEELTHSMESVEQRIELILLACEFSISTKTESCCSLMLNLMGGRDEPWRLEELADHPQLQKAPVPLLLSLLLKKSLVQEVAVATEPNLDILELRYALGG